MVNTQLCFVILYPVQFYLFLLVFCWCSSSFCGWRVFLCLFSHGSSSLQLPIHPKLIRFFPKHNFTYNKHYSRSRCKNCSNFVLHKGHVFFMLLWGWGLMWQWRLRCQTPNYFHQGCMNNWRVSMCKDEARCALDKFISHSCVKQTPSLRLETYKILILHIRPHSPCLLI